VAGDGRYTLFPQPRGGLLRQLPGSPETVQRDLREARADDGAGAPRIWENMLTGSR